MQSANNVYTIPARTPFLRRLAQFVLDGSAGESRSNDDPLALTRTTIYLPTRRAVRSLRSEFSALLGGSATFLPVLRTLGDGDEENIEPFFPTDNNGDPARIVDPLARQVQLARLVKHWVEAIGEEARQLFQDEDIIIPSSSAEALWLAKEVGDLIDQMQTEEVSWQSLKELVPNKDQYANWWQLTLDFLQIAMKSWPQHLEQIGACDPASFRRQLLDLRTLQLKQAPPRGPVIAAGSTGSIPATARFLKAVSELERGVVILPGLDKSISDEAWAQILGTSNKSAGNVLEFGHTDQFSGSEDHPQYGLAKLLGTMGIMREEVTTLCEPNPVYENRSSLVGIALLPSKNTDQWRGLMAQFKPADIEAATRDITIIDAPAERQEALAISLVLRQQIETPDIQVALVTPDRNLARRVAVELQRFNLNVDDSGGSPLDTSANVIFLRLLISVATRPANAITLASFVKHPFLFAQSELFDPVHMGRLFEVCFLRDVLEIPRAGKFSLALSELKNSVKTRQHLPAMIVEMVDKDWEGLGVFCLNLDRGLEPLIGDVETGSSMELAQIFEAMLVSINLLTKKMNGNSNLFDDDAGIELAALFEQIGSSADLKFSCRRDEILPVFDALIAGNIVRSASNTHPRLSILGPLEARLLPLDCVILGGLNEGTWPAHHDSGPFLNRPMKTAMELATPERRTGLAAHDFEQLLGCGKVFLTRSARVNNAPTVPSRWLQRLTAVCGSDISKTMCERGSEYLNWVNQIDEPDNASSPAKRPCPKPPVKYRPTRLSITEIETWIRDPYAIYARRILKLAPLGNIGEVAEPALRGTILHDAVAEFVQSGIDPFASNGAELLTAIINKQMLANKIPTHISALWTTRFDEVVRAFIAFEREQQTAIAQSYCEISGKINVGPTGFELRGRADRINLLNDGSVAIIDYKTGTKPTAKMARTLSPQLALEGAMVMAGGFGDVGKAEPSVLEYVRLRARGEFKQDTINNQNISAPELCSAKIDELEKLIAAYNRPEQGYISRFAVHKANAHMGDYDHLARVREWSLSDEDGEGGDDD
ncbi:MAG: double-strand break repair protein AddB [Rhizobiaceae bacterium]|nr:double-strand break repair protein AddB [Rhizobiaceae bacterium]